LNAIPTDQDSTAATPIRLTVDDDLARNRLLVFFRLIFSVPYLIWLAIWSVGAFFAVIGNWVATLFRGEPPASLHDFLARFVRYTTHVYAYLYLASEQAPSFSGRPGNSIDLEIDPPRRQNRWTVAFRAVLVLPALAIGSVLTGTGPTSFGSHSGAQFRSLSLLLVAAFLGWFFALIRGRMPRGLRDLVAYGLAYAAQLWGYLLVLTDRYPTSDPFTLLRSLPTRSDPVWLEVRDGLRRSRLTVFFRLVLAVPHLVWLTLWGVLAVLAAILNWFATLILGTSPNWLHRFLAAYVRYQLHVSAFLYLTGNPFPGFVGAEGSYPIDLHIAPRQRQNRWTVLFRLILAVPALILASAFSGLVGIAAVLGWFAALATGRMPPGLRNAGAFALRYMSQANAYLALVNPAYPYSGPCLEQPPAPAPALPGA
jgi:hypothetical protein